MSQHAYLPRRPLFPSDLRRLFRSLARIAVAGSFGVAAAGCDQHLPTETNAIGQHDSGTLEPMAGQGVLPTPHQPPTAGMNGGEVPAPSEEWRPVACIGGLPALFEYARLEQPIDYAALYRRTHSGPFGDVGGTHSWGRLYEFGSDCSGALDESGCFSSIDALVPDAASCFDRDECDPFVLTTQGDRVTRIAEQTALLALLGEIDTDADAVIATLLSVVYVPNCYRADDGHGTGVMSGTRVRSVPGGYEVESTPPSCDGPAVRTVQRVTTDGVITEVSSERVSDSVCLAGRRPMGLAHAPTALVACSELGAYLANAAYLEAASVHSFVRLAAELRALGAPDALVAGAVQAALDEIAHARTIGALAVQHGGVLSTPSVTEPAARTALEIALENTVEGCMREAYGALVACYQAQTAQDHALRAAMTQIAEDETRHAQLSMSVAAWLEPQLSSEHQALLAQARVSAFAQLARELTVELSPDTRAALGMPSAEVASFLLTALGSALGFAAQAA